jgi:hypothetical protein
MAGKAVRFGSAGRPIAMNHYSKPSLVLQGLMTCVSIVCGLVPLSMSIGILEWGGMDRIIVLFLVVVCAATIGLIAALFTVTSRRLLYTRASLVSACAMALVTAVYLVEFVFFRTADQGLRDTVPFLGAERPLLALYVIALICFVIQIILNLIRIKELKIPR